MEERLYDLMFICRPATPEEDIDKIIATLEHTIAERGGKLDKKEKWGARKMAYRVKRHREGYYVLMVLRGTQGDMVHELERRLKVNDAVIKYMTVRLDEDLKRQKRLQQRRERKAARRPRGGARGGGHGHPAGGEQPPVAAAQQQQQQ
ncbi:MAG TPA: 30S ribosomal protein S6 [Candidatus Acidoferrales bacterium]|nr:30S ribosomal protein S6 [Candidatus Acidoferrales bacterium]